MYGDLDAEEVQQYVNEVPPNFGLVLWTRLHDLWCLRCCLPSDWWPSNPTSALAGDLVAFGFAAQSLLAPLGGSTIVFNALMAPCFVGEVVSVTDIFATGVILVGCTLTVNRSIHRYRCQSPSCCTGDVW